MATQWQVALQACGSQHMLPNLLHTPRRCQVFTQQITAVRVWQTKGHASTKRRTSTGKHCVVLKQPSHAAPAMTSLHNGTRATPTNTANQPTTHPPTPMHRPPQPSKPSKPPCKPHSTSALLTVCYPAQIHPAITPQHHQASSLPANSPPLHTSTPLKGAPQAGSEPNACSPPLGRIKWLQSLASTTHTQP